MLPSRLFFDDNFFKGEENIKCDVGEINIGDKIFIKDLVIPEGMRLDVDEDAIVATIADNSAVDTDEDQSEEGTEPKQ